MLLNFANCLDPDQDLQNVGPDLDPKLFLFLKGFLKKTHIILKNLKKSKKLASFIIIP